MSAGYKPVSRAVIIIALEDICAELQKQQRDRETTLAITKLQEAIMWLKAAKE